MLIIGCDPGKSFGVAALIVLETSITCPMLLVAAFQGTPEKALDCIQAIMSSHRVIYETNKLPHDDIVLAIERFIVTPGAGRRAGASDTSPLVGRVTQLAGEYPEATVALQTSADAARGFPNALLRRLGVYSKPSEVGQRDANDVNSAVRHALLWIMRNRADFMEVLMKDIPLV
jgi:hypothetical protein